jgi:hypothetical protein
MSVHLFVEKNAQPYFCGNIPISAGYMALSENWMPLLYWLTMFPIKIAIWWYTPLSNTPTHHVIKIPGSLWVKYKYLPSPAPLAAVFLGFFAPAATPTCRERTKDFETKSTVETSDKTG